MTLEEAFAELGLEPPVDADVVRRAYLKALKTRKPETDPDGFQRLREAYEMLREFTAFGAAIAAARASAVPSTVEPTASAPSEESSGAIVEIVAPTESQEKVSTLLDAEDFEAAAALAKRVLDRATARPELSSGVEGSAILFLVLQLYAHGSIARARGLTRKMKRWLDVTGAEARLLSTTDAALFAFERDLAELPGGFPEEVVSAFAQTIRDGDRKIVGRVIGRIRRKEGEGAIEALRLMLREDAPTLFRTHGDLLRGPPAAAPKSGTNPWAFSPVIAVLAMLLRTCGGSGTPQTETKAPETRNFQLAKTSSDDGALRAAIGPASAVADAAAQVFADDVAAIARAMAESFARDDCDSGIASFRNLSQAVSSLGSNKRISLLPTMNVLRREIASLCLVAEKDLP